MDKFLSVDVYQNDTVSINVTDYPKLFKILTESQSDVTVETNGKNLRVKVTSCPGMAAFFLDLKRELSHPTVNTDYITELVVKFAVIFKSLILPFVSFRREPEHDTATMVIRNATAIKMLLSVLVPNLSYNDDVATDQISITVGQVSKFIRDGSPVVPSHYGFDINQF
ncbi:hypothetical protein [Carp edema virus]|nr:hypothetical protein [Carp edema virus]